MNLKWMLLSFTIVIQAWSSASRSDEPTTAAPTFNDIRLLLQANGSADVGQFVGSFVAQQFIISLHRANPNLPTRADKIITDAVIAYVRRMAQQDQFAEKLIPIYAKYLTKEDVRRLTEFYRSPVGQKLVSATPGISVESARVGQQWMESILPGLQAELLGHLRSEKLIE